MAGDYTKLSFKPRQDHSAVFMQQGKVQLDADWNHLVEMFARRFRVETADVIGRCAYPTATGDGFKISVVGTKLMIGKGRMYVDGLLAENHGTGVIVYEPIWSEETGKDDVPYDQQPYFMPATPALPLPNNQKHLLYLDVFERELTAVELPSMVEKALGIDTATNLQTAWQVRVLQNVGSVKCDSDWSKFQPWVDLTAPSAGRLTSTATPVLDPGDPCVIPPAAGYRGVENRLYRVEIHNPGGVGAATFKWSRDNGAVAAVITQIADAGTTRPKITVNRIGRDPMLRFKANQWVELIDDQLELSGQPGVMAQVDHTDDVHNVVVLSAALAGPAIDVSRNARMRRWDQTTQPVTIDNLAKQFPLELGLSVQFDLDPGTGTFHTGDYWVFAARSIDGSVEPVVKAPPRGVRHHYCRLALYTPGQQPEDCRTPWPPPFGGACGDCTECVTPESHAAGANGLTIQAAVDKVKTTGGKVCLAAGLYKLEQPVTISGTDIHVAGKGWRTIVFAQGDEAFHIEGALDVTLEEMTIATAQAADKAIGVVSVKSSVGTAIRHCNVIADLGKYLLDAAGVSLAGIPSISAMSTAIGLDSLLLKTDIGDNVLIGGIGVGWPGSPKVKMDPDVLPASLRDDATGIRVKSSASGEGSGPASYLVSFDLHIHDNLIVAGRRGIDLGSRGLSAPIALALLMGPTSIRQNSIFAASEIGILVSGFVPDAQISASYLYSAANATSLPGVPSSSIDIRSNALMVPGYGISVGSDRASVADNDVTATPAERRLVADGVVLHQGATFRGFIHDAIVTGNRINGFGGYGIAVPAVVLRGQIDSNVITRVDCGGIVMDGLRREGGELLTVSRNIVSQIGSPNRREEIAGIQLYFVRLASITDNTITSIGTVGAERPLRSGIRAIGCDHVTIGRNAVSDVGPSSDFLNPAYGIDIPAPGSSTSVTDNRIVMIGEAPQNAFREAIHIGVASTPSMVAMLLLNDIAFGTAFSAAGIPTGGATTAPAPPPPPPPPPPGVAYGLPRVLVKANNLEVQSEASAVFVEADCNCLFGDNMCHYYAIQARMANAVVLHATGGGSAIATSNYVEGDPDATAIEITTSAAPAPVATILGNVTTGDIQLNGIGLAGTPWEPLNRIR